MRILHVVYDCVPRHHRGGVQKAVLQLAQAQSDLGTSVDVATLRNDPYSDVVERHGGILIYRAKPTVGLTHRYSHHMRSLMLERKRYDVVHIHNPFSPVNITGARLAAHWNAALFAHVHGALDPALLAGRGVKQRVKRGYVHAVERPLLNSAQMVFALSNVERDWLSHLKLRTPICVASNGVEPITVANGPDIHRFRRSLAATAEPRLLYVGRFVPKKNIEAIIEAVDSLRDDFPNLELILAGDRAGHRSYVAYLDKVIAKHGLSGVVRWVGFLDEKQKQAAYATADIFVHASHSEGMPMSVLEGMAAGLPCVVSTGTMMSKAATAGAVVECSPTNLGSGIRQLAQDAAFKCETLSRCREYLAAEADWRRIAGRILSVYEAGVVAQRPARS